MVAVLDSDPELGAGLAPEELQQARREALAPLRPTHAALLSWKLEEVEPGHLGLLVLDGVLARQETIGELQYIEVVGANDILRPWTARSNSVFTGPANWQVLVPGRIAILDRDFALRTCRWPQIAANLVDRAVVRSRTLGIALAIHRAVRVQDRVLLMLWHLAERWGHVTPNGVVLPIPLTHMNLAHLTGAQRSPVTTALGNLNREGLARRNSSKYWLLSGHPPTGLSYASTMDKPKL